MTKLSEQVREAMDKLNRISIAQYSEGFVTPTRPASYAVSDREYDFFQAMRSLTPKLLAEHEAMERAIEKVRGFSNYWDGRCRSCLNRPCDHSCTGCPYPFKDFGDGTGGFEGLHTALATLDKELKEIE